MVSLKTQPTATAPCTGSEWIELSRCLNLRGQGWRPGETVEILDSSALFWLITVRFTVIDLK